MIIPLGRVVAGGQHLALAPTVAAAPLAVGGTL